MRLWHENLISLISGQRLIDLHRTCCALRGNGWGKKNRLIDFVWQHEWEVLVCYHLKVLKEMRHRGYKFDTAWETAQFRGYHCGPRFPAVRYWVIQEMQSFPEMDHKWLIRDVEDLMKRGDQGVIDAWTRPCATCGQIGVKMVNYAGAWMCEECIIAANPIGEAK